jgi:hypothetical protein
MAGLGESNGVHSGTCYVVDMVSCSYALSLLLATQYHSFSHDRFLGALGTNARSGFP